MLLFSLLASISCGHSEFYVQITFSKPFKGLLYAYRNMPTDEYASSLNYPVQILDSCTLRGYGASVVYLELSFLSECVEQLPAFVKPEMSESPINGSISNDTSSAGNDTVQTSSTPNSTNDNNVIN